MHGSVQVERHVSKPCELGSGGGDRPLDRVQRRCAGGIQSAQGWPPWHGLGSIGAGTPLGRWAQGERSLPRVVDRRYDLWLWNGFNALEEPLAEGMQRGRAAGPLAKQRGSTTHSLRPTLSAQFFSGTSWYYRTHACRVRSYLYRRISVKCGSTKNAGVLRSGLWVSKRNLVKGVTCCTFKCKLPENKLMTTELPIEPNTQVQSSLSDEQRSEIKLLVTSANEYVFIEKHSNKILRRVWVITSAALVAFGSILAWIGWDQYSSIEDEVATQINEQVNSFIQSRADEISSQVRSRAEEAAQEVVDDELARITAQTLQPRVEAKIDEFEERLDGLRQDATSSVEQEFTRVFPVLQELEDFGPGGLIGLRETVTEIGEGRRRLNIQVSSQSDELQSVSEDLQLVKDASAQQGDNLDQIELAIENANAEVIELRDTISGLSQSISATREICSLFGIVPPERFVDIFGEPVPDDDPELPYRIGVAIETIRQECDNL